MPRLIAPVAILSCCGITEKAWGVDQSDCLKVRGIRFWAWELVAPFNRAWFVAEDSR